MTIQSRASLPDLQTGGKTMAMKCPECGTNLRVGKCPACGYGAKPSKPATTAGKKTAAKPKGGKLGKGRY